MSKKGGMFKFKTKIDYGYLPCMSEKGGIFKFKTNNVFTIGLYHIRRTNWF